MIKKLLKKFSRKNIDVDNRYFYDYEIEQLMDKYDDLSKKYNLSEIVTNEKYRESDKIRILNNQLDIHIQTINADNITTGTINVSNLKMCEEVVYK